MTEIEGWQTLDDNGIQMPWLCRSCLKWMNTIDLKNKKVFEYGVGYSTKWFESRGAICYGVDDKEQWSTFANKTLAFNKTDYLQSINVISGRYDLVVIDGIYRDECLNYAYQKIKKGGYIIIDNWLQPSADLGEWPNTQSLLKDMVVGIDYYIYEEPSHADWKTLVIPT